MHGPVKLDVLAGQLEQLQEAVSKLILADALVPNQQQVLASMNARSTTSPERSTAA